MDVISNISIVNEYKPFDQVNNSFGIVSEMSTQTVKSGFTYVAAVGRVKSYSRLMCLRGV